MSAMRDEFERRLRVASREEKKQIAAVGGTVDCGNGENGRYLMRRQTDQQEIEEMRPTAWRPDGTPTKFEIVASDDDVRHPPAIGWDDAPIVAPVQPDRLPRVQHIVQTNALDEARGFNLKVSSLAAVLGGGVVLAALMFGASLSFWSALMWFGTVFAAVWAGAFVLDSLTSAGGVELFHSWRLWAFLDREQAHRHNRYSAPVSDRVRLLQTIIGTLAMGVTALFFLLVVAGVAMENMPR
jgi:hypothetical protein